VTTRRTQRSSKAAESTHLRLVVIVGASILVYSTLALLTHSPWIVPDELIYSEMAKSLGSGDLPAVRDETSFAYGIAYPLLISPGWALFDSTIYAFEFAKISNAIIMSTVAIPSYFLARNYVAKNLSIVVSIFSVLVPSMMYTGTIMTEVVFYPLVICAVLAISLAIDEHSWRRQAMALFAIAIAFLVKPLAACLLVAYGASKAVSMVRARRGKPDDAGRRLSPRSLFLLLTALSVICALIAALRFDPRRLLGAYSVVLGNISLQGIPEWFYLHVIELELYTGLIPFLATMLVIGRAFTSTGDEASKRFTILLLPVATSFLLAVAAYSSKPLAGAVGYLGSTARLHERNLFFLTPLLFIGLAIWIEAGLPRLHLRQVVGLAFVALLPATLPLDDLRQNAHFQALALVPWSLVDQALDWVIPFVVFAIAATALLAVTKAGHAGRLWVATGAWLVAASAVTYGAFTVESKAARNAVTSGRPDWIDRAVGRTSSVSVFWREADAKGGVAPSEADRQVWINEFFNRSLDRVYTIGRDMPYNLPTTKLIVRSGRAYDAATLLPISPRLVLAPCTLGIVGSTVASDAANGLRLVRVRSPLRLTERSDRQCFAGERMSARLRNQRSLSTPN